MTITTTKTRDRRRARRGDARAWLDAFIANFHEADDINACVLWPFSTNGGRGGKYPQIRIKRQTVRVTRYILECVSGQPLAAGELIRHTCDTPRCVNPWHFETGDQAANMADMVARRRSASGDRNGSAKLTADEVREIRQLAANNVLGYGDVSFIARGYGVTPRTIKLILTEASWKDV